MTSDLETLALGGVGLTAAATFLWLWASLRRPDSSMRRLARAYGRRLERDLRLLVARVSARRIIQGQLAGVTATLVLAAVLEEARFFYLSALGLLLPPLCLRWAVAARVRQIEEHLDGWLLMLANMLRTTSSLADAVAATSSLVSGPIAVEIDLVLKEVKCGAGLDDALRAMGARIGSRLVSATLTALLVGRNTGGDLPRLLEETASALRELRRMEAVLASRTSEARTQMFVMGAAPPALFWAFRRMDPTFFDPLYENLLGNLIFGMAIGLWLVALALSYRILRVDI